MQLPGIRNTSNATRVRMKIGFLIFISWIWTFVGNSLIVHRMLHYSPRAALFAKGCTIRRQAARSQAPLGSHATTTFFNNYSACFHAPGAQQVHDLTSLVLTLTFLRNFFRKAFKLANLNSHVLVPTTVPKVQ